MLFFAYNYLIYILDMDVNRFNDLFDGEYENVNEQCHSICFTWM
jgi:hypothetical protein